MSERKVLREWVAGVLKEIGENVPGGQPPPGAGLGGEGKGIVVRSITDNGFEMAADGSHAATIMTISGEIASVPFVLSERIPLAVNDLDDFDEETGKQRSEWVASVEDPEFIAFKVDGIALGENERDDMLDRSEPGGVEFNATLVSYLRKLEERFGKSPMFHELVDQAKESADYGRDPYAYYGVKRSDF